MHHPVHGTAGTLQRNLERLQGAFALLSNAAQLQAAVGTGRDLRGDQHARKTDNVGGNGVRVGIRDEGQVVVCHGDLLLEVVKGWSRGGRTV
ncbi:hypothetical protein D3C84_710500 [compost metagenome]